MSASTPTADPPRPREERWLIGHLSEHRELQLRLDERAGLLVLEADPLSGTSALLAQTLPDATYPYVAVDARAAADALDLATLIADTAITTLAPSAAAWWNSDSVPFDAEGLRLSRALSLHGVSIEELRTSRGAGLEQLRHALELVTALTDDAVLVLIDHLDTLLERISARDAIALLGVLRAERQRERPPELLLIGRTGGRLATALRDRAHPLYRAGQTIELRRPTPQRFRDDLAVTRPWSPAPASVVFQAAELTHGVPAYVWRVVELAGHLNGNDTDRVVIAWRRLCELGAPQSAEQYELLASVHRAAPTLVSTIAAGLGPYEAPIADKSIYDALRRMRSRGAVFKTADDRWAVSDPVLARWARHHAPSWLQRRARASTRARGVRSQPAEGGQFSPAADNIPESRGGHPRSVVS